ncbi:VanZ family protein [Paratractidigestivibacter sp.]|uniref:VanZ family protein n=1 Tax=Paratractidigestivibacter sp. TaxID=2847316 RepID=UPI002ABDC5BC|nr:VanZ family protein [Paratractidigestivibacter sp.]
MCARLGSPAFRWGVFLALWCCFIWGHSLIQGPQSSSESGFVYSLLRPLFDSLGLADGDICTFIIRKTAHFSEYAILGAGVLNFAKSLYREGRATAGALLRILFAFALVPVADETLQLFVPGRSGAVRDVCIDLTGYATGMIIATVVVKLRRKA